MKKIIICKKNNIQLNSNKINIEIKIITGLKKKKTNSKEEQLTQILMKKK
jgi:hypothetical protein